MNPEIPVEPQSFDLPVAAQGTTAGMPYLTIAAFFFGTTLCLLHTVVKYLPTHSWTWRIAAICFNLLVYALILSKRTRRLFQSKWTFAAMVLFFFVAVAFIYPIADAKKLHHGGSDQDDAMIMAVDQLSTLRYPYHYHTYLGNPISPGPGWILLNVPITAAGLYQFTAPLLITLAAFYLQRISAAAGSVFLALLIATPSLCESVVIGSDMVGLGCALMLLALLAYRSRPRATALLSLLIGFVSSARINLISFPIALYMLRRDRMTRRAILEMAVAVLVSLGLQLGFFLYRPQEYAPYHLIEKGRMLLEPVPYMMPVVFVVVVIFLALKKVRNEADQVEAVGCYLLAMHLPPALGLLRLGGYDWPMWEGYYYLLVAVPCLAASLALWSAAGAQDLKVSSAATAEGTA